MDRAITEDDPPSPSRPPGGIAHTMGIKMPRKVQWVDNPMVYQGVTTRELDEHGLDLNPFETLTHALEHHQSTSIDHLTHAQSYSRLETSSPPSPRSPLLSPPSHDIPGEHYIDPNEKGGLPGTDITQFSQTEASKVVRAHKRGLFGNLHLRRQKQENTEKSERKRRSSTQSSSDLEDVEKDGQPSPRPQLGTGVLSALLSLYDHQRPDASTPGSSQSLDSRRHSVAESFDSSHALIDNHLRNPSLDLPKVPGSTRSTPFWKGSRPAAERNAGGVFGALIASTGNITGVAAPANSTLAPDIKRPGYKLSRYSLDNVTDVSASRIHQAKTSSRPSSSYFVREENNTTGIEIQYSGASTPSPNPTSGALSPSLGTRRKWSGVLADLPKKGWSSISNTPIAGTPNTEREAWLDEKTGDSSKDKKKKRKKAEIYITRHVAEIIKRQEFILKLARVMMMFGGPSHRFQAQIQSTAKVLEIELSCMYLPDIMLISFDDTGTGTSSIKFIRQAPALDLGKLQLAYRLYWKVIHDKLSVKEASIELDALMRRERLYNWWQIIVIGAFCSAWICSVGFNGSFIDSLISFPMGGLLVSVQLASVRNELYSNVFEITISILLSFLAAAFASTHIFCYSAIASASVVLILPGFIVLMGSLELSSRNIVSGAVRLCFACVYSLFLGFGLAIGLEVYQTLTGRSVYGPEDYMCSASHPAGSPWYRQTPSAWWAFLTVPMYSLFLSLRNQAPWNKKEMPLLVIISCIGWVTNHFTAKKFPNQSDISAAVGAFAVGFIANLYGRFFRGNAFAIMITGILFQLPSGLGNGGLLTFATSQTSGTSSSTSYLSGFQTALQLISVCVGLTVGLGISLVIVHPIQPRRRAGGVFSL